MDSQSLTLPCFAYLDLLLLHLSRIPLSLSECCASDWITNQVDRHEINSVEAVSSNKTFAVVIGLVAVGVRLILLRYEASSRSLIASSTTPSSCLYSFVKFFVVP